MSSVSRATFDTLKVELDSVMLGAVSQFAAARGFTYDSDAMRMQCAWTGDSTTDLLMFGCDVFPADIDDDGGEPMIPAPVPANDTGARSRFAMAAALFVALTAGMWTTSTTGPSAQGSPAVASDTTLSVTGTSALLPDAIG